MLNSHMTREPGRSSRHYGHNKVFDVDLLSFGKQPQRLLRRPSQLPTQGTLRIVFLAARFLVFRTAFERFLIWAFWGEQELIPR